MVGHRRASSSTLLRDRALELQRAVRDVEQQRDQTAEAARTASDQLAALEHARGAGEDVAGRIVKAEKALAIARADAAAPWAERLRGAQAAARGAGQDAARFATANFGALSAELAEDGHAAKEACDDALARLAIA